MNDDLNKKSENRMDKLFDLMEQLIGLSIQVVDKDKKRARLRKELFDDGNRSIVIKSFEAIEIIRKISYSRDKTKFFSLLKEKFIEINRYDDQLGKLINAMFLRQGASPLFLNIYSIFLRYPKERVFVHFKDYSETYSQKLLESHNKKIAAKILEVIKDFLISYENVSKQINLLYQRELILLNDILGRISVGEEEATWKDFLNVYRNMKQICRAIEEKYLDRTTADELRACLKDHLNYGEQPEPWKAKFKEIIYGLQNKGPMNVINRIEEGREMVFIQAKKSMTKIAEEMGGIPKRYRGILLGAVKRREKELNKNLAKIREDYDNVESTSSSIAERFYMLLDSLKYMDTNALVKGIRDIEAKKEPLYNRGSLIMSTAMRDDLGSFKILSDNMPPLFVYENALMRRLEELKEKQGFYSQLPKLAFELRNIIPNFEKQLDYLIDYLQKLGLKDKETPIYEKTKLRKAG